MFQRAFLTVFLLGLLLSLPGAARADNVDHMVTAGVRTDMRAGPGKRQPLLAGINQGMQIHVLGCLFDWKWCEVEVGPHHAHGWIPAHDLRTFYLGRHVTLDNAGYAMGFPMIGFDEENYWRRYYPTREFYVSRYVEHAGKTPRRLRCNEPGHSRDCSLKLYDGASHTTGYWQNGHYYVNDSRRRSEHDSHYTQGFNN